MTSTLFFVLMTFLGDSPSRTSEPEAVSLPSHASPEFGFAKIDEGGRLTVRYTEMTTVWKTTWRDEEYALTRRDPVTGREVVESLVRRVPTTTSKGVALPRVTNADREGFSVFRNGKFLSAAEARQLLGHWIPVAFLRYAKQGQQLDPFYSQFLPKGTIIIFVFGSKPVDIPAVIGPATDPGAPRHDEGRQKPLQYLPRP